MSAAKKLNFSEQQSSAPESSIAGSADADVRRIAPYPFAVDLLMVEGQPPLKGMIVKMTDIGFLMKVETSFYKVSQKYQINFVLPVMEVMVRCQAKVVKTYDGIEQLSKEGSKKQYIVELHFIELPSTAKTSINSYLHKSGQKKF